MKKQMKRFGALALAAMMAMAMGTVALAASTDGTVNEWKGIETSESTINIAKQMVFVNDEDTTVREPNIDYTYTITSATPGTATITDHNGISSTVKAGPIAAVTSTTATVAFKDTNTSSASLNGTSTASKSAAFTFDPSKFLVDNTLTPGIYRYKISETCSPTKASVGITQPDGYKADRFLDVYVKWNTERTGLEIYGYVLFEGSQVDSIASDDVTMKSQGYVNTSTTDGTQTDVDVYKTENLYINKVTTGAMADKGHDFPIAVTLTAPSGVSNVKMDVVTSGNGNLTTASDTVGAHVAVWGSVNGTVRDGSQIAIKGVPANAIVSIVETNNTVDSYKVKAGTTADGADLLTEAIVAAGAAANATSDVTLNAKSEIHFTNTLDAISPTGVALRVAPYALMLAAGVVLFLISRRRKERT